MAALETEITPGEGGSKSSQIFQSFESLFSIEGSEKGQFAKKLASIKFEKYRLLLLICN